VLEEVVPSSDVEMSMRRIFREQKFIVKGRNYTLTEDNFLLIVNLQKSKFGPSFYVNIGVWYKDINRSKLKIPPTRIDECDAVFRLDALLDNDEIYSSSDLAELLSDEYDLKDIFRVHLLSDLLARFLFVRIGSLTNSTRFRNLVASNKSLKNMTPALFH
jgi:Domain of unknown function (DUF4304)